MYSEKVIEHFMCPRNIGNMPYADDKGIVGDPECGDSLEIYINYLNQKSIVPTLG